MSLRKIQSAVPRRYPKLSIPSSNVPPGERPTINLLTHEARGDNVKFALERAKIHIDPYLIPYEVKTPLRDASSSSPGFKTI